MSSKPSDAPTGVRQRPRAEDIPQPMVRALTERMTVCSEIGMARGAPAMHVVTSASGSTYHVDVRAGACDCPDRRHRDRKCKHLWRAELATGETIIPGWVDVEEIDATLGCASSGAPRIMTAGGQPRALAEVRDDV